MKYKKLNRNWNSAQVNANAEISMADEILNLTFNLDPFKYEHIDEGDKGVLEFFKVYAYQLLPIDKESYMSGQFRFSNSQLPWGEFYELTGSNWKKNFPEDKVLVDGSLNSKGQRHFILFFPDTIFECVAEDYKYRFIDTISEKLESKYQKGYLNHYLAMFATIFNTPTVENFRTYTDLYIQMEGEQEFDNLRNELKKIKVNNDIPSYLKFANFFEIEGFGKKQFTEMIKVIEAIKPGKK